MLVTVVGYEWSEKGGDVGFANLHYLEDVTPGDAARNGKDGVVYKKVGSLTKVRRVARDCVRRLQPKRVGEQVDISLDVREFGGKQYAEIVDINYQ